MAVLPILSADDPKLRRRAKRVTSLGPSLQRLIDDMIETMHHASGVGLAATQVGVPLRVVVIGIPDEEIMVLVNPEMVKRTGEREVEEGCLSLPGYRGQLKRALSVTVKGKDRQGREIRVKGAELLAQALEHELDHLNGVLYFDRLENRDKLYKIEPAKEGQGD
ncbi:MAG: peptide deformylase [Chloroflexota bacterium]|nr:peptide deformylase [Chloroflexota bacterium]